MQKIGRDKWKHFFVGMLLAVMLHLIFHYLLQFTIITNLILNGVVIFLIAYGFELFSKYSGHGHYEMKDVWATLLGGVLGAFGCFLIIP